MKRRKKPATAREKRNKSIGQKKRWARQGRKTEEPKRSGLGKGLLIGSAATVGVAGLGIGGGVVLGRRLEKNAMSAVEDKTKELTRRATKGGTEGVFQGVEDSVRSRASQDIQTLKTWAENSFPARLGRQTRQGLSNKTKSNYKKGKNRLLNGLRSKLGFSLYTDLDIIEFSRRKKRRPTSAATRKRIKTGVKRHWDQKGSRNKAIATSALAGAGVGATLIALKKNKKNKAQVPNIAVEYNLEPNARDAALGQAMQQRLDSKLPSPNQIPGVRTQWNKALEAKNPANVPTPSVERVNNNSAVFDAEMNLIGRKKKKPNYRRKR